MKIAWLITGSEYLIEESIRIIEDLGSEKIEIFLSKAGEELLKRYNFMERLEGFEIKTDRYASSPEIFGLFSGKYRLLVVAPATSNSIAKFVCGIADNLITNMFAQAGKLRIPIVVMPSDCEDEIEFTTKTGKTYKIWRREIDRENIERLGRMENVIVVNNPQKLREEVKRYLEENS